MTATHLPPELDTPCLLIDVDVLDRNIAAMGEAVRSSGLSVRPHVKTHKCLQIAQRQVAAGATGLTVATVAEAEVFSGAGFLDVFIAYPVWASGQRGRRLRTLAEGTSLRVGVDSAEGAAGLAKALSGTNAHVLVEIDSGHHRTGVRPADAAEVGLAAARAGLRVAGVFTFPGHGYAPEQRGQAALDEARALDQAARALERAGLDAPVRSGGSTPTVANADPGVLTEVRPGVYVFNDAQQGELGSCSWRDIALTAAATVVSRRGSQVVLDAGSKVLGADQPGWATGGGRLLDHLEARLVALSEHHATALFPGDAPLPDIGEVVRVVPNHVCAAVNLADELTVISMSNIVDRWRIAARGANT
jgi:D-serine deaminase-like pyridoxal phosphate-dependent protein